MQLNRFLLLPLLMVLAFLIFQFADAPFILESSFLLRIILVIAFVLLLFFLRNEPNFSLRKQYFKVSTIFLIGFCIVHFQIYIDYILGNYSRFGHDFLVDKSVVPKAIVVSAIALTSFVIGYIIKLNRHSGGTSTQMELKPLPVQKQVYDTSGLIVLAIVFFILFLLNANMKYFQGQYGQESLGEVANYFQDYFTFCLYGIILLNCWNLILQKIKVPSFLYYIKYQGKILLLLLLVYLSLVVISGDRGPILQLGVVYLGGYIIVTKKKYKLQTIGVLLFLAVFISAILGYARTMRDADSFMQKLQTVDEIRTQNSSSNSFSPNTFELATSVRTLHAAVRYTDKNDFSYGLFQGFQVIGIIPGLGILFKSATGYAHEELRSTDFLTRQIQGNDITHGLGTTCVADIYLDFGIIGIMVLFLLFGYFLRYLEEAAFSFSLPSLFVWVMVFVFLSKAVYIGRATIVTLLRECVICFLITMLGIVLSRILFKKGTRRVLINS